MDRLRAMELFLSIAQTRNFSETARRFGISATAVSRMITDIENELKVTLLLRSTRQVVLTESGQEYAREIEGIMWRINELRSNLTAISSAPQGLLRVHSRVMFGLGVLPPLIAEFRKLYPNIHIELTVAEAQVDLRRNQVDIDFRISPPVEAGVKRRMLFQSHRHLVAAPAYLSRHGVPREIDELQEAKNDAQADRQQKIQHPQTDAVHNLKEVDHGVSPEPVQNPRAATATRGDERP